MNRITPVLIQWCKWESLMKLLNELEIQLVSGGDFGTVVQIDGKDLEPLNFSNGFDAGVNLVGGIVGFMIGIPASIIVLPARGIITLYHYAVK